MDSFAKIRLRSSRRVSRAGIIGWFALACLFLSVGSALGMTRVTTTQTGLARPGDLFGQNVKIMGDTLAVSVPDGEAVAGVKSGAVEIYRRQPGGWQLEAALQPGVPVNDMFFGGSLALGTDIVVAGCGCTSGGNVLTFERSGTQWTQTSQMQVSSAGGSDGITLSNGTLVVTGATSVGAYIRSGTNWILQQDLAPQLPAGHQPYGASIDSDSILVLHTQGSSITREAYASFFTRSGGVWTLHETFDLGLWNLNSAFFTALSGDSALVSLESGTSQDGVSVFARTGGVWSAHGILDAGAPYHGISLAIDGALAVVGSSGDTVLGHPAGGTAYVFANSAGVWSRIDHIYDPAVGSNFQFGFAVSISGNSIAVGSIGAYTSGGQTGKASVFEPDSGSWHDVAELSRDAAHEHEAFGQGVAMSGSRLLVGAPSAVGSNPNAFGAAYLFEQSGAGWTQQARLTPTSNQTQGFGGAVALDGDTAVVGANYDQLSGAAYIYSRNGTNWPLQQRVIGSGSGMDYFGMSVSLRGDLLAVGAPGVAATNAPAGTAYLFSRSGVSWSPQAAIQPADTSMGDEFGYSVDLSGADLIVGAPRADVGIETDSGAAYVFTFNGATWEQQARLVAPLVAASAGFGLSVALEGDTAVVGSGGEDASSSARGAAYVFKRNGVTWSWQATLAPPIAGPIPGSFGHAVALSTDESRIAIGTPTALADDSSVQGAAYVFGNDGAGWESLVKLQASLNWPFPGASFGTSLDFSGNDVVVGSPSEGINGAAYVTSVGDVIFANGFD